MKQHFKKSGPYWSVYLDGKLIASWPTIEEAWRRYKENTSA